MTNPDKIFGRLSNRMFQMAALYAWTKDNNIPFFVQDEKYFLNHKNEIKNMFSEGIIPNSIDMVAVHVRRAKNPINPEEPAYSENSFYVDLGHHLHEDISTNYYIRAMNMFPNEKFLVFSDDIEWCKQSPLFEGCEFYHGSEIEDMNLMASCKSHIIANSSFSWWAAYLGEHDKQKVVAPKQWFADINNESLIGIPEKWTRI